MNDMLAAFYFIRHLDLRAKEQEPYREFMPEKRFSVALGLFRRRAKGSSSK